ncbi:hypothetical protein I41_26170 [Lacipirellula limnantheis]|uniref:Uncharacterized protein n=1 Tax=Lacipirellula limnantheis TaxID=2528024 RepID=A0A517TYH1_9BACT|nr:hypothetical protein I41_26170 [Lacipirellula limnantheis]
MNSNDSCIDFVTQAIAALVGLALFCWGIEQRADPLLVSGAALVGVALIAKAVSGLSNREPRA